MRYLKTLLTVVGALTVLILAGNTIALGATGHAFILGKANTASTVTKLTKTTSGPALVLNTKKSANPPFATNATGKVTHLNADKLDGLDSTALKSPTYVITRAITVATTAMSQAVNLPVGDYLISYSAYLQNATNATVGCFFAVTTPSGSTYFAESRFTSGGQTPGLTGSGYASVRTGTSITLNCGSGTAFQTFSGEPIQIVATRVDTVSKTALRTASNARTGATQHR